MRDRSLIWIALLGLSLCAPQSAQTPPAGIVRGTVRDATGLVVGGVQLTLRRASSPPRRMRSDPDGGFEFRGLAEGAYTLEAAHKGFAPFERQGIRILTGQPAIEVNVDLELASVEQHIDVQSQPTPLSLDATENASATVLRGAALDALPDDPDELEADLRAMAGPSTSFGSEIFIDGFSGGRLPPKDAILEVRINQNPFSAEYDHVGLGRIEILTKPGSQTFHGMFSYKASDASMNSRNPFADAKPPYRSQQYDGDLAGPLGRHVSFFLDVERRMVTDNAVVNASVLNSLLQPTPFNSTVTTPLSESIISPRLDFQISQRFTLSARYSWESMSSDGAGIGQFNLAERGYSSNTGSQTAQLTLTGVLSPNAINTTLFQYLRAHNDELANNPAAAVQVLGAFNGGGAQIGHSYSTQNRYEFQNNTALTRGAHSIQFGGRVREAMVNDFSTRDFGGVFLFSGGLAPVLSAQNLPVTGPNGAPLTANITSLEQYRRTLYFTNLGYSAAAIRALGGEPSQFSISAGQPLAAFNTTDGGIYIQDDWRVAPGFSLNLGVRYEAQSWLNDWRDVAPRIGFAWSPHGGKAKYVVRGGSGIFYDRVGTSLILPVVRFNGVAQQQYVLAQPNFFPNVPSAASLQSFRQPLTIQQFDSSLRAPYVWQNAISLERQLPFGAVAGLTYLRARGVHLLMSRNVNAPLPGTYNPADPSSGNRPLGLGNYYNYESTGILNQDQLLVNYNQRLRHGFSLFGYYAWDQGFSNTDGPNWFPANPFNLRADYGRSATSIEHRAVMGGYWIAPLRLTLSSFLVVRSGAPFDITTGSDLNGDSIFNDRPAFASSPTQPGAISTPYGVFNPNPAPGQAMIPRNYGTGPAFVTLNTRLSRTWGFGGESPAAAAKSKRKSKSKGGSTDNSMLLDTPSDAGIQRMTKDRNTPERYNLTLSITARNLLNHVNPGLPIGNLSSPLFGQSNWLASPAGPASAVYGDNRRIFLELRLSF